VARGGGEVVGGGEHLTITWAKESGGMRNDRFGSLLVVAVRLVKKKNRALQQTSFRGQGEGGLGCHTANHSDVTCMGGAEAKFRANR